MNNNYSNHIDHRTKNAIYVAAHAVGPADEKTSLMVWRLWSRENVDPHIHFMWRISSFWYDFAFLFWMIFFRVRQAWEDELWWAYAKRHVYDDGFWAQNKPFMI